MSEPTTVELFCGIGGFRVAADALGLRTVWANDLNPHAAAVYRGHFGAGALQEGDITTLTAAVPPHDLLTAGFPCQPFSAAGKKAGIRDPRGTLFQTIVDVLEERAPRHFVLENVKRLLAMERGAHFATVLSALSALDYAVEWRVLNARHFGLAQNRERVLLVGTRSDVWRDRGGVSSALRLAPAPDLHAAAPALRQRLADAAGWTPLAEHGARFPFWGVALQGRFVGGELPLFAAAAAPVCLVDVLEPEVASAHDFTDATRARLAANDVVGRFVHGVEIISNQAGGARMGYTIFGTAGLAPTLTASTSRHYERYLVNGRYRRLTPTEYARLQGFADAHCAQVPTREQYALYGNAVPPPMVSWALRAVLAPDVGG